MKVKTTFISLDTKGFGHMVDLTEDLNSILKKENLSSGAAFVFVPGSTGAVTTIEYEPGLIRDLPEFLQKILPSDKSYHHDLTWHDGNGYAHLRAALLGPDLWVPFDKGKLLSGTWQQVVFIDFDNRPRHREIVVQLFGE
jgi:secondary thiamine-phosphate synthase enzyme